MSESPTEYYMLRTPCPDVHRMVNGRCENCGMSDPFADKPFDSVDDFESSLRAFAYAERRDDGNETGVTVLTNSMYGRLLATARAGLEDRERLDWLEENVDCAEDETWRGWIDGRRKRSGQRRNDGGENG